MSNKKANILLTVFCLTILSALSFVLFVTARKKRTEITACSISSDDSVLALANMESQIVVWDIVAGVEKARIQYPGGEQISTVAVSKSGEWIACGRADSGVIEIADSGSGQLVRSIVVPNRIWKKVQFIDDDTALLLFGDTLAKVSLIDGNRTFFEIASDVETGDYQSRCGVFFGDGWGDLYVVDGNGGAREFGRFTHRLNIVDLRIDKLGGVFAVASLDKSVSIWKTAKFELIGHYGDFGAPLAAIATWNNGYLIAACDTKGILSIWDGQKQACTWSANLQRKTSTVCFLERKSVLLVMCVIGNEITYYDAKNGREMARHIIN